MKRSAFLLALSSLSLLAACGNTSSPATGSVSTPPPTYTIGGAATNLVGTGGGLKLQDNGGDTLMVNANGTFTFPTSITSGNAYNVTVFAQPTSPAQICGVTHATGTATANVTNVAVDCAHNEWTWVSGSNLVTQKGTYGTAPGTSTPGGVPGAREGAVSWTDSSGNFWLFGGYGYDSTGTAPGYLNDIWKYSAGQWTWEGGSNLANQIGSYGIQGTAGTGNVPGARDDATYWTDTTGNLWVFGGLGYDSAGTSGLLNDLWKYSPNTAQWTWIDGSKLANQKGAYGLEGTGSGNNIPGARVDVISWTDSGGNLWLFGGAGLDTNGASQGSLNDLWKFSPTTTQWTWVGGSSTVGQNGVYGIEGTGASSNIPGSRYLGAHWTDASGNFWLFGGYGLDSAGTTDFLNDLWKFNPANGQWTWVGGSKTVDQRGAYGTLGTAVAGNIPGARYVGFAWTDALGNAWIFGGYGFDSAGTGGYLNDLWKYNLASGLWTWMTGASTVNQKGIYGTEGTPAPGNVPGARLGAPTAWTDSSGNFWLLGAIGYDSTGTAVGYLNDLWKYEP